MIPFFSFAHMRKAWHGRNERGIGRGVSSDAFTCSFCAIIFLFLCGQCFFCMWRLPWGRAPTKHLCRRKQPYLVRHVRKRKREARRPPDHLKSLIEQNQIFVQLRGGEGTATIAQIPFRPREIPCTFSSQAPSDKRCLIKEGLLARSPSFDCRRKPRFAVYACATVFFFAAKEQSKSVTAPPTIPIRSVVVPGTIKHSANPTIAIRASIGSGALK